MEKRVERVRGLIQEFQEFAVKGNVVDLAVGIIIGAAFGKIVSSLVADIIMPPIGVLIGGVDFSNLQIVIKEAVEKSPAVVIAYGKFIQTIIDFIIISGAVFLMVKAINSLKRSAEVNPETPPTKDQVLLTEIRDLLKSK